jgi:uncharacterized membrane protein YidH (DUF202 family)
VNEGADVTRRTWLAAERTWLSWWRAGIAVGAVAIAVGRLLPGLTGGAKWPFRLVGIGYALLSVLVLVVGAIRQERSAAALRQGDYAELTTPLVMWLTAAGVLLAISGIVLIAAAL